jgi:hypothetical protein
VVETEVWVEEPSLISLAGWELEVETGEEAEGCWRVRRSWVRRGDGGVVDVVQA